MAKRKKSLAKVAPGGFGRVNLIQELQRAEGLIRRKQWPEAMQRLSILSEQFPQAKSVWQALSYVTLETNDMVHYQRTMEKLVDLDPANADYSFALGSACMTNVRPMLALQSLRQGLALDPDHAMADQAQRMIAKLESLLEETLADMGMTEADGLDMAVLHERGQACLERGDYDESRQATLAVIERHPEFLPAQNNLSLLHWAEGDVEAAIAQAQQVIDQQPDNVHALANLVRFYALTQRLDQAHPYAERLKASHAGAWDGWTKKAEALTLLADDKGVVALFEDFLSQGGDALGQADPAEASEMPRPSFLFYHWVAVALARTGKIQRAKALWQGILSRDPHFDLAKANLTDLRLPVGQRHGAWPLSWEQWLLPPTMRAFRQALASTKRASQGKHLISDLRQFLDHHPDLVAMLPRIGERGGPLGQQFIVLTAEQMKHPGLLAALKDFALGKHGPDDLRYKAAVLASQAKLIEKTNVTLWRNGAWQTVTLMDFEIHHEATYTHSKRVGQWLTQAIKLLRKRTPEAATQAEELLNKAIAAEPESPDLYNNLAAAYQIQGRSKASEALVAEVHQRFPDYTMAAMAQARRHLGAGDLEAAEAILKTFMARDRFHVDEFSAFCETYADLMLAKGMPDGARSWLQMWEQTAPEHPRLSASWAKFVAYTGKHLLER